MVDNPTGNSSPVDPDQNNGLITKIWGPSTWMSMHCITFGYPVKPSEEQKRSYKEYFTRVGDVLPCRYCRDSYKQFISSGEAAMTDDVFESRKTLTEWLYRLHNRVNKKLGVDYSVKYEDIVQRYESYRARCVHKKDENEKEEPKGCLKPLYPEPYKMVGKKDAPVIPFEIVKLFIPLIKSRGIWVYVFSPAIRSQKDLDAMLSNKNCDTWSERNKECCRLITRMRRDNLPSVHEIGDNEGLPTDDELKLISMFSSNLPIDKLIKITEKLSLKKYYLRK